MEAGRDFDSELSGLRYRVEELNAQLRGLFAALGSLPVLPLVALSLFSGAYRQVDESDDEIEGAGLLSLGDLPGQASDFDNGAVQVIAVLTILALIALAIAAVALLVTRRTLAPAIAAAAVIVLTFALQIVVSASGGEGAIHELGAKAAAGAWWPLAVAAWCGMGCWLVRRTH